MNINKEQILEHLFSLENEDGSFRPSATKDYCGIADGKVSEIAATTYIAEIAQTLGETLPHPERTVDYIRFFQDKDGCFRATPPEIPAEGYEVYNTCMAVKGLKALGCLPEQDVRPWLDRAMLEDKTGYYGYRHDFAANIHACYGSKFSGAAFAKVRDSKLRFFDEATGWCFSKFETEHAGGTWPYCRERNNPMAFHTIRFFKLCGQPIPFEEKALKTFLAAQESNGSWSRGGVHGNFDAIVAIRILDGQHTHDAAIQRAADWAETCLQADGGFNHFGNDAPPELAQHAGAPSEVDACYFHVATLVMAGRLPNHIPPENNWIGWGHSLNRDDEQP